MTATLEREEIAKRLARWIGYSWEGLGEGSTVAKGFPEWSVRGSYQGRQGDLLNIADAILSLVQAKASDGREIIEQCAKIAETHHNANGIYIARMIRESAPTPSVQEEPVAWLSEYDGHTDATTDPDTVRIWRNTLNRRVTPLFATPSQTARERELEADLAVMIEGYAEASRAIGRKGTESESLADQITALRAQLATARKALQDSYEYVSWHTRPSPRNVNALIERIDDVLRTK